jgi:phage tail sheath protein FI
MVSEDRRIRLASLGVNTLQSVRSTARMNVRLRTLAGSNTANADWRYLGARRLALFILSSIEHGTRAGMAAGAAAEVSEKTAAQVRTFFEGLLEAGTFGPRRMEEAFFVICDERVNNSSALSRGEIQIVIGFAASREHEFHCFRVLQSAAGSKIQSVSLNRLTISQYSPAELEWVDSIARSLAEHSA